MKKILMVDDGVSNLFLACEVLKKKYEITGVTNTQQADTFLTNTVPDLILLDLYLPEIDGRDYMKKLKSSGSRLEHTPIVILTSEYSVDIESECLELGAADFVRKPFSPRVLLTRIENILSLQTYQEDIEVMVEDRTDRIETMQRKMISNLAELIETRDAVTGHHIARTGKLVELIVKELDNRGMFSDALTPVNMRNFVDAAPLHDIGKISISDTILMAPRKLTQEEFEIIKTHCATGEKIIRKTLTGIEDENYIETACSIALNHHEKWDGSGYPNHISGDKIPLCAQIMAIADVFEALISKRPYKEKFAYSDAFGIIEEGSGKHFNPLLADIFLDIRDEVTQAMDATE